MKFHGRVGQALLCGWLAVTMVMPAGAQMMGAATERADRRYEGTTREALMRQAEALAATGQAEDFNTVMDWLLKQHPEARHELAAAVSRMFAHQAPGEQGAAHATEPLADEEALLAAIPPEGLYQLLKVAQGSPAREKHTAEVDATAAPLDNRLQQSWRYSPRELVAAAQVAPRVIANSDESPRLALIRYRLATAYYRAALSKRYSSRSTPRAALAIGSYLDFALRYPDHELADDALYWAANAALVGGDNRLSYDLLTIMLTDYPDSETALMHRASYAHRRPQRIREEHPRPDTDN